MTFERLNQWLDQHGLRLSLVWDRKYIARLRTKEREVAKGEHKRLDAAIEYAIVAYKKANPAKTTKLGSVQRSVLGSLVQFGYWNGRAGWIWSTPSGTQRIMDSLVRRGMAAWEVDRYVPTDAGRALVRALEE